MNGTAHLTLSASQLARHGGYFVTTLWDLTPPEQLNCPAHLAAGSVNVFHQHVPIWKRSPFPQDQVSSLHQWELEFDGFMVRDSTGGIQLQAHLLLWLLGQQWQCWPGRVAGAQIQAQREKQGRRKTSSIPWAVVWPKYDGEAASWVKTILSRGGQWAGWSSPVSGLFTALPLIHSCLFSYLFWGFVFFLFDFKFSLQEFGLF